MTDSRARARKIHDEPGTFYRSQKIKGEKRNRTWHKNTGADM